MKLQKQAVFAAALAAFVSSSALAQEPMRLDRSFILFRHGLRSPLDGEAGASAFAPASMPGWNEPPGDLTEHGAKAAELLGSYLRVSYAKAGLLPAAGCPVRDTVTLYSNSAERTIATAQAIAAGLAPGCPLSLRHRREGVLDPVFSPVEAGAAGFDAAATARAVISSVGGLEHLVAPHATEFQLMELVLGCGKAASSCDIANIPSTLTASRDGHSLILGGPIAITSGTAEIFLLQYMQGLPPAEVAWGRADGATLARMSVLHSLLFDVMARPRPMSTLLSAPMRSLIAHALSHSAPRLTLLVGHDDNIAALASWFGLHFQVPGYGADDPPIGGGLGFEVWRNSGGQRFVRAFYISQTPDQIRNLAPLSRSQPPFTIALPLPACADGPEHTCPIASFVTLLSNNVTK